MGCFSEDQTHIELDFKRPAKYIFLLPTNMRKTPEDLSKFFKSSSIEIIFFGVQGHTLEEELPLSTPAPDPRPLASLNIDAIFYESQGKKQK